MPFVPGFGRLGVLWGATFGMKSFRDLQIWKTSQDVFFELHAMCRHPVFDQDRYLKLQLLRAALSIHLNIAEGAGRAKSGEFAYFLRMSRGSLDEVQSLLYVVERLHPGLFPVKERAPELDGLRKSSNALYARVKGGKG